MRQIRIWSIETNGISGFEVTFQAQSDFTGYEPVTWMFGTRESNQDYFVIDIANDAEIKEFSIFTHSKGKFSGFGVQTSDGGAQEPTLLESTKTNFIKTPARIIGFRAEFSQKNNAPPVMELLELITDTESCEVMTATFSDLPPFDDPQRASIDEIWSY